jgi:TolB-like protein/Flp pilus assembly protein TadD
MSPEQAEGKKLDARSDIFSFGAVLYEMVTGNRAFSGASRMATISAVLRDEPSSVSQAAPEAPSELERIIQRCMRKDPARRAQNIADVKVQLEEIREESASSIKEPVAASKSAAAAKWIWGLVATILVAAGVGASIYLWKGRSQAIDSVAVLPFSNAGADPGTEYLSDGVTESLTNALSQLPNLKVASRNSASRIKDADAKRAGSELGVRAVLMGRVRQQGDSLAISVELVDSKDNSHIWGERYDRKLSDLTAVQQEITADVAEKLQRNLNGRERTQIAKRYSTNGAAYQLYLRGRYNAERFTKDGFLSGIEYFRQAINSDPNFALAYDGISYAQCMGADLYWSTADGMPKAKDAARKALSLDESLPEPHVELANVLFMYDYDWKGAEKEFRRAIEIKPDYAPAHEWYGWLLVTLGRRDEAIAETMKAVQLDPLSPETSATAAQNFYFSHRYEDAIRLLRKVLEREPDYAWGRFMLGVTLKTTGDLTGAITELQKAHKLEGSLPWGTAELAAANFASGNRAEGERYMRELREFSKNSFVPEYNFGYVHLAKGDKEQALRSIEKAYEDRSVWMTFLPVDPEIDSLQSEPRVKNLIKKLGL